jgi:hypothetical protein
MQFTIQTFAFFQAGQGHQAVTRRKLLFKGSPDYVRLTHNNLPFAINRIVGGGMFHDIHRLHLYSKRRLYKSKGRGGYFRILPPINEAS